MTDRLFVYGTLAPGRPNEHILAELSGSWQPASVKRSLRNEGWGASMGYPGIVLSESGETVDGFIFQSKDLSSYLKQLDDFEGDGYKRVKTLATLENGAIVETYIYVLKSD